MSDASRSLVASAGHSKVGPDYFGYYTHEIAELLFRDQDFLPFTSQTSESCGRNSGEVRGENTLEHGCNGDGPGGSFFHNGVGAALSDFKKERLKALLRQSVIDLTPEVDEILDPVIAMRRLQSQLRSKKCLSSYVGAASDADADQVPHKKLKMSSCSSSTSISALTSPLNYGSYREVSGSKGIDSKNLDVALSEKGRINGGQKNCAYCHTTKTPQWSTGPGGPKSLCNACGISYKKGGEFCLGSNIGADKENGEMDDDLKFLLENDSLLVEETTKKYSDELSATLGHMERQLEELLDTVVSSCRPMTLSEKQHLRKLIQKLPPKNLDRVVEIIQHSKPAKTKSYDEMFVDLEQEDNVTLWRLYFYVEAVERAKKQSL